MDKNKRRSSLRQPPQAKEDDQTVPSTTRNSLLKRRISFSGKKSVREFVNTEEPHYWDNSYELSDHTNGEDSRERASKTGPCQQTPTPASTLQCERTQIDTTLNLRTSIDVPMLPCETNRNRPNSTVTGESLYAESFSLSSVGRDKLKDTLYNHRIMDKTIDLMHISTKAGDDCSLELFSFEKEKIKTQPTRSESDSFMDITPLGFAVPVAAAPVPVAVPVAATVAAPSAKQSFMDLEQEFLNCSSQRTATKEKENVYPVQKSVCMEMEESGKESQRQADVSFDCDMNVSDARDRLPSNASFGTESNNSTINYLGDESVLIPFDVISGKNISRKLTFRQLNDELEAGKIKVFVNGPRTPTTDRSTKQKRFWHGLDQDQDQDPMDFNIRSIKPRGTLNFSENMTMSPLVQAMPVAARVAEPVPREKLKVPADDKRRYRLSQADEMMLDNTNFLAHAKLGDETQSRNNSKSFTRRETTYENSALDLGLPSRHDSQASTIQQEAASKPSKPRQTINQPTEMEQDVFQLEEAATAIPKGRSCARRTLHMNESMDQEATTHQQAMKSRQVVEPVREEIACQSKDIVPHKGTKSKRRETLLMVESMEEEFISPVKEVHLNEETATMAKGKSKPRHTLHLAEPVEEDQTLPQKGATNGAIRKSHMQLAEPVEENQPMRNQRSKARQTILQAEPIEEDAETITMDNVPHHTAPVKEGTKSKRRETLLLEESMEEELRSPLKDLHLNANAPTMAKGKPKPRHTLHLAEPVEEDQTLPQKGAANGAIRKSHMQLAETEPVEENQPMRNQRSKARQTILQAEPIEEDVGTITMDNVPQHTAPVKERTKSKRRETLLLQESMEEELTSPLKDLHLSAKAKATTMAKDKSKARHTLHLAEPVEEDQTLSRNGAGNGAIRKSHMQLAAPEPGLQNQSMGYQRSKARQTILQAVPIEEDPVAITMDRPTGYQSGKSRHTLLSAEPIEEDVIAPKSSMLQHHSAGQQGSKSRHTLLMSELEEEDAGWLESNQAREQLRINSANKENIPIEEEFIEEEVKTERIGSSTVYQSFKWRQTLLMSEPIEEDHTKEQPLQMDTPIEAATTGYRSSKSSQTLLMAEPIEEDTAYQSSKQRNTHESKEKIPCVTFKSRNTLLMAEPIEENLPAIKTSKARQTLLLATSMEEEKEQDALDKPLTKRGFRAQQTMIMSESMEEEDDDAFHSPLQSIPLELLPITPMQKHNHSTSGNSMNEFEDFEEETNRSAAPRGPLQASLRNKPFIDQSVKMELEGEASGFDTPIRHSGHPKRLPAHLTPNLPESKKRNTQHTFAGSKMLEEQQQMAMELSVSIQEVAAAAVNKSQIPIRESIKMENFNETVQPVRDFQGARILRQSYVQDDPDVVEVQPSQATVFEERAITISDVSNYFQSQPGQVRKEPGRAPTTEQEHEEKRNSGNRDSGSSTDRSFKSYVPTNQRFINLSGDTTIFSTALVENIDMDEPEANQIDNVRLSLVSTLADEPDSDEEAPKEGAAGISAQAEPQPEPEQMPELCQEQKERSRVVAAGSSAACRKCRNCRRSLNEAELSNDSFVLPSLPQMDLTREIELLRRVRQKPNLDDVHKYWQIKEQERQTDALEHELDSSNSEEEEEEATSNWDVNEVLSAYKMKMEGIMRNLAGNQEVPQEVEPPVETFFDRLEDLLAEQQPNWTFDYQLKISRKLIFTHRLHATFRLIVDYETVDQMETAIRVGCIEVEQATAVLPLQEWTAFEHLVYFQLQLKLPVSLTNAIGGSTVEDFAQFLHHIDTICEDVKRTFQKLLTVVSATGASLIRQPNRTVIKKTVRRNAEVDTHKRFEKTDFVIEIGNAEKISFTDILQPKLHLFDENIQFLPTGVAFLEAFLHHPEQYLRA